MSHYSEPSFRGLERTPAVALTIYRRDGSPVTTAATPRPVSGKLAEQARGLLARNHPILHARLMPRASSPAATALSRRAPHGHN